MADPFSVSASIAGLVTLADIVFHRIFKYVQAVKGADKEISALSSEVGSLYGILSSLRLVSRQLDEETFDPATRIHHVHSCTQTLEKLRGILDRDTTFMGQIHGIGSIKRKMRWPFTSSKVKTLLAEIERHKTTLGLALNVDTMSGLLESLSIQGPIHDSVNEIKIELKRRDEADTRILIDAKRQSVLRSFGHTDPSMNQKMGLKLRQPGTGMWLIESHEFQNWAHTENAKLWLYGIPGAGKTVLASTIIEEVLRGSNTNHAVAFFYCDHKDPFKQKPSIVLGSLVQQIAKQDEQSFEKAQNFCDKRNPEHRGDFDYDPQELQDLIYNMTSGFESATIVVDGLDECGKNAYEVTELLAGLNSDDGASNTRTLFLSRDEVQIRICLEGYDKIPIAARSSDLRLYVGAEIDARERKGKLRIKDHSLKEYVLKQLVEGAEGMYVSLFVMVCCYKLFALEYIPAVLGR